MATINVKCRFYNQIDDVKKHGTGCGNHQRYRCQSCRKTFQIDYTYRVCKPGIKEQIVDLAMNNAGIKDTARALHISINTVVHASKKLSPRCVTILPLDKLKIVLLCEVDKMWSFVIGKKLQRWLWYAWGSCIQYVDTHLKMIISLNKCSYDLIMHIGRF